jgi:hypothetical protein
MVSERLTPEGYDKEEEYFHRKNQELIEKSRKKLDAERAAAQQREQHKAHWMVCPKCGGALREVELKGVKVDRCGGCGGLFLDKGEAALLIKGSQPSAMTEELKEFLKEIEPV